MFFLILSMVNIVAKIADKAKEVGKTVISDVLRVAKSPAMNFIPLGAMGSSAKQIPAVVQATTKPSVMSKIGGGVKTIWKSATTPKMPTLKQFLGGTAFFIGAQKAFQAGRSGVSGERFNPIPTKGEILRAGGAGFSPTFAVGGATTGAIELFGKTARDSARGTGQELIDMLKKQQDLGMSKIEGGIDYTKNKIPELIPSIPSFNFPQMTSPANLTIGMPSAPSVSMAMPSISVGGGGGLDLAMLALLAGAGGGYLLGRKRRKKKYKKRKKR